MTIDRDPFDEIPRPPSWQKEALCRNSKNPDAFFPERGSSTRAAKALCVGCPVKQECLEYAVEFHIQFGIWGGTSQRDRRVLYQQRQRRRFFAEDLEGTRGTPAQSQNNTGGDGLRFTA